MRTPEEKQAAFDRLIKPVIEKVKDQYNNPIVLLRVITSVTDDYVCYGHDAIETVRVLGIYLHQAELTPSTGFPVGLFDEYLPKLLRAGNRVAIVDTAHRDIETRLAVKNTIELLTRPA